MLQCNVLIFVILNKATISAYMSLVCLVECVFIVLQVLLSFSLNKMTMMMIVLRTRPRLLSS